MTLDRRLNMKLIIHIHRETGGDCAGTFAFHTRGSGERRIHICPNFFDQPLDEQATTFVHELAHGLGFFGRGHPGFAAGAINPAAARKLASNDAKAARRSPWNYELLFQDLA